MFEVGSAPTSPETTKRRRLERLSGSNTIFITVGEAGESNAPTLPSCGAGFEHLTTIPKLIAADKTRYIEELDKEPAYQYLFLRPRRFGKSTFLQTLSDYYDETKRDSFDNIFRDLYIGQHPTKSRNSLLVLCFNFSGTPVLDNFDDTKKYFHKQMHLTLLAFLNTNQAVLSPIEGLMVADDMGSLTLQGVLSLVKRRGKELFVGVDEYDAPGNSALFSSDPGLYERVAEFFSTQFYGVIKEAVSQLIVVKYWLTGVLPAFRDSIGPLLAAHIISNESEYHGLCGLTDAEVQTIARAYLSSDIEPPALAETMRELQRRYGGYRFCAPGDEPLETLYNPQLVFTHLRGLAKNKSDLDPRDEIEAVHTARPKYDSK
ncbi:DUF1703-domain-containing protein [Rickenella mellea]|uniref:DUF1703-domain-containing protein n=1 Tax=Rickenella mellea TaxID=50990 RepID=A0A4Y7QHJ2_9AGAM|nr:DUF1703-domain-containing protein [Rickenella mellea]